MIEQRTPNQKHTGSLLHLRMPFFLHTHKKRALRCRNQILKKWLDRPTTIKDFYVRKQFKEVIFEIPVVSYLNIAFKELTITFC